MVGRPSGNAITRSVVRSADKLRTAPSVDDEAGRVYERMDNMRLCRNHDDASTAPPRYIVHAGRFTDGSISGQLAVMFLAASGAEYPVQGYFGIYKCIEWHLI